MTAYRPELSEYNSRSGEPAPGEVTFPVVAAVVILVVTSATVSVGFADKTSAATPATCGEAIDVPEMVLVDVVDRYQAEVMAEPGAKISRHEPKLE